LPGRLCVNEDTGISGHQVAEYQDIRFSGAVTINQFLSRKAKTDDVTPAEAGVQDEKTGFPLSRE